MTSTTRRRTIVLAITSLVSAMVITGALPALAAHLAIEVGDGVVTTEAGGQDTFTVALNADPTTDVTVSVVSGDTGEATVSPATLTFTADPGGNWATPQTVTVTGIDDAVDDTDQTFLIDLTVGGVSHGTVSVTNTDDDVAGITVTPTTGLETTEVGGTATFTVVLTSQPTANVTIPVSSADTTEATVDQANLTFTSANWNTAQTVTVTGVDDAVDDGNTAYTVTVGTTTSTDLKYHGTDPADVTGTNLDDDTAGITVTPTTGLETTEAGGTDTFTVVLDSQPTGDVTIPVSSSDTTEATVDQASLTFTAANWATAQTVTVTGADDFADDGNIAYTITLDAATSGDTNYNGKNPSDVTGTNLDNDAAPAPAPGGFTDLGGLSAETVAAIQTLVDLEITKGTSATTFSPSQVVSRWQMALFLTRQLVVHGVTLPVPSDQGFVDLAGYSAETQDAIAQLAMLDVTTGTSATTYSPSAGVTRAQMALFMTRVLTAAGVNLPDGTGVAFDDISGLDPATQLAIKQLAELGVVFGVGDGLYDPSADVARWQMALFIVRTLEAAGIAVS